jgi:integrase/recombinase XerD
MNYHVFLSSKRANASGMAPVYAKITIESKVYERSSGVFICPENWNKLYKRVKPSASNSQSINKKINDFETKLEFLKANHASIEQVDRELQEGCDSKKPNFMTISALLKLYVERQEKLIDKPEGITYSTFKTYKCKVNNTEKFLRHCNKPSMGIESFDYSVAEKFKDYLYSFGFCTAHVNKHTKFIKTIMRFSQYEFATIPTNFMIMKVKEAPVKQMVYLTINELHLIQKHVYLNQLHQKTADIFLLQCYTGMCYGDIIKLSNDAIIEHEGNEFISYERLKTKVRGLVPFLPQTKSILNRYNGKAPVLCNQLYNRILKEIASVCNISKHLTSHVGRKTFACLLISNGASMETTTKMLAKTNIRETAKIYAEVQWPRLLAEFNLGV